MPHLPKRGKRRNRMRFKNFYTGLREDELFNLLFEKYYSRKHFGNIDKDKIKFQQKEWYKKLKTIIEERDYHSLFLVLEDRNNKVSRDFFHAFTGINIKKKSSKNLQKILEKFCKDK